MPSVQDSVPITSAKPVLIIDKKGVFGVELAKKISKDYIVILATGREVELFKNLIVISYKRKIPRIPDNTFRQIIVVSHGEPDTFTLLPALEKKAEEARIRIAFIFPLRMGTEALYKRLQQRFPKISLFLTGDVFGGDMWELNLISDFLSQIKRYGKVVIPNTGLYKTYPVAFDDVIAGVIHAVFVDALTKRIYNLFPSYPVTALSVARMLQQAHPEIGIDFHKTNERQRAVFVPDDGEHLLTHPYPLARRFSSIDIAIRKEPTLVASGGEEFRYKKPLAMVIFGFILLLLMPFLATAVFSLFGLVLLENGKAQLEVGKYQEAKVAMGGARNAFMIASETGDTAVRLGSFVGVGRPLESFSKRIKVGEEVATAGELLIESYLHFFAVQNGTSPSPKDAFASSMNNLRQSMVIARQLVKDDNTPAELKATLDSYAPIMQLVTATSDLYPELLGLNGKKVYLVLFQNNMELRPGGGFIGSYGLLTMHNGKVQDFTIHNVYDADGQLKGHIEPPFALRRYLGSKHLFLRDSNFSVDFPKNAAQAAYLLELETGVKADGVLAVDMHLFRSLFEVTGPVKIPNYSETVDANNVYLVTQRHVQNNSFPGSKQKQTFLQALFAGFTQKLEERGGVNPALMKKIADGIKGKHIMLVVLDKGSQNVLTLNNLSGALWDSRKNDVATINDVFGISEANLGENKTNYYLQRSFDHVTTIENTGVIQEDATITYNNTSQKGSEFGGPYEAYIRAIIPAGAELLEILVDGKSQAIVDAVTESRRYENPAFVPPPGIEVSTAEEEGKQIIGFYFIIPEDTKKRITLRYRLAQIVPSGSFTYSQLFLKQPGTESDPYIARIRYPSTYKVVNTNGSLSQKPGELTSFGPLDSDKIFSVRFAK
jgi:hypothetical protein